MDGSISTIEALPSMYPACRIDLHLCQPATLLHRVVLQPLGLSIEYVSLTCAYG